MKWEDVRSNVLVVTGWESIVAPNQTRTDIKLTINESNNMTKLGREWLLGACKY